MRPGWCWGQGRVRLGGNPLPSLKYFYSWPASPRVQGHCFLDARGVVGLQQDRKVAQFCLYSEKRAVFCKFWSLLRTRAPPPPRVQGGRDGLGAGASRGRPRPRLSWKLSGDVASRPSSPPQPCCPIQKGGAGAPGGPGWEKPRDGHSREKQPRIAAYNGLSGAICNNSCNSLDRWS